MLPYLRLWLILLAPPVHSQAQTRMLSGLLVNDRAVPSLICFVPGGSSSKSETACPTQPCMENSRLNYDALMVPCSNHQTCVQSVTTYMTHASRPWLVECRDSTQRVDATGKHAYHTHQADTYYSGCPSAPISTFWLAAGQAPMTPPPPPPPHTHTHTRNVKA